MEQVSFCVYRLFVVGNAANFVEENDTQNATDTDYTSTYSI